MIVNVKEFSNKANDKAPLCQVVIECSEPDENGNIEVQMHYEGEKEVAAYLIASAYQKMCAEMGDE